MSDLEDYWAEVTQALREVHGHNDHEIVKEWLADVDLFLEDQLDFGKAAYASGYYDAMDDARTALADLERKQMTVDE